jgi:phosphatidylglycerophosphate synthase
MQHECVILADSPSALIELCGITTLERLLRTLQRCGITHATVLSSTPNLIVEQLAEPSWPRARLELTVRDRPGGLVTVEQIVDVWPNAAQLLLVVRSDAVFDIRLLRLLSAQSSAAALVDAAVPPRLQPLVASAPETGRGKLCGAALLQRDWALTQRGSLEEALRNGLEERTIAALDVADEPLYYPAQLRDLRPFWFPVPWAEERKQAERVLLDSVQKGGLDIPALIHGPIEKFLVSHLCKTSITPNHLTVLWAIGALATTLLFAEGQLVWGIAVALIVGIVDGLDGKQARIKVETTKGGKLEHQLDSLFAFVWPTALAYHFYISGQLPGAFRYLFVLLLGEALDGLGQAIIRFTSEKLMEEPGLFDRMVRLVGGRRNIYIWVLTVAVICGTPAKALIVMAWWEMVTAAIDLLRAGWSLYLLRRRKVALTSC